MGVDILLDNDFDLSIDDGDFVLVNDLEQRINCILNAEKGHYKQFPLIGAHIRSQLNGPFTQKEIQEIQLQLEVDQIRVSSINYLNGELIINANSKI